MAVEKADVTTACPLSPHIDDSVELGPQCASRDLERCKQAPAIVFCSQCAGAEAGLPHLSAFGRVFVVDHLGSRYLRFDRWDGDDQSSADLRHITAIPMEYVRFCGLSALAFRESPPQRLMVIGLGGGSFASLLAQAAPGAVIDAVELDPVVVHVARRYFSLVSTSEQQQWHRGVRVHVGSGDEFVRNAAPASYSVIFLDGTPPPPMHTTARPDSAGCGVPS